MSTYSNRYTSDADFVVPFNYTRDASGSGKPALYDSSSPWYRTETLPYVLGDGRVRELAREVADSIIQAARTVHGPVVWITSNAYMPPMRDITQAEHVYQAENNSDGELWALFVELVEDNLSAANVALESPDYDNALYAVDLNRWQYITEDRHNPDYDEWDINSEWEPVDPHATDDNRDNPRE